MRTHIFPYLLAAALTLFGQANLAVASPRAACSQENTISQPSTDCSSCHPKYVQSMKNDTLLACKHAKAGTGDCTSCHAGESLKKAHEQASETKAVIRARRYPQEFCLKCHGTVEDLAKKTANSKVLTDEKGRTVNPHDLPKTPAHKKAEECANCHRMHKPPMEPKDFCYGCHHKKEFACTSCHSDKK